MIFDRMARFHVPRLPSSIYGATNLIRILQLAKTMVVGRATALTTARLDASAEKKVRAAQLDRILRHSSTATVISTAFAFILAVYLAPRRANQIVLGELDTSM